MLPTIPNLESVVLRFDKNCAKDGDIWADAPQSLHYRKSIIQWLGAGLSSLKRPLKELAIQNQQNVTSLTNDYPQILSTLDSLRLNIVHEIQPACPENEIEVRRFLALSTGLTQIRYQFHVLT